MSRLEAEARWERDREGNPRWARVLCARPTCPGPLAWVRFPVGVFGLAIVLTGMHRDKGGIWRPTAHARKVYKQTGVLAEQQPSQKAWSHWVRSGWNPKQRPLESDHILSPLEISRAECVRCGTVQKIVDEEDIALLTSAMREGRFLPSSE